MTVTIGSNIPALIAQRRLGESTSTLSRTFERLSTGQRINRASDDAAGLAIAERLNTDQRLYGTALRNVNDGISAINILDGALEQQSRILQRLAELSEQSANGTFSSAQRGALDDEYEALLKEFTRIAETTSFNGQKLLLGERDNGLDQILLQAGIDGAADSVLQIAGADTGSLSGVLDLDHLSRMDSENGSTNATDRVNYQSRTSGNRSANPVLSALDYYPTAYKTSMTDSAGTTRDAYFVPVEYNSDPGAIYAGRLAYGVYLFDSEASKLFKACIDGDSHFGFIWVDAAAGEVADSQKHLTVNVDDIYTGSAFLGTTGTIELDLSGLKLARGEGPTAIDFTGVETVERAKLALTTVKNRIEELASIRGVFGAALSRLETAAQTMTASRENVAQAGSRIMDADIAAESATLVQTQILQQAASAVLAQAGQAPALALRLLS